MKNILVFSGSNHSKSINNQLISFTASLIKEQNIKIIDISQWVIPIYSIDMDPDITPNEINQLIELIQNNDAFIISSPEHNGATPAFFKNIIDWLSRRSKNVFENKSLLLISTSPGKTGGIKNRSYLESFFPRLGANVTATYSLPNYYENMLENKLQTKQLNELQNAVDKFINSI